MFHPDLKFRYSPPFTAEAAMNAYVDCPVRGDLTPKQWWAEMQALAQKAPPLMSHISYGVRVCKSKR